VTGEGSFAELPVALTTPVTSNCSPADLAAAIELAADRQPTTGEIAAAVAPFSPEALAARLATMFRGPATGPALRMPA
jgi:hypothetical protein